MKRLFPLEYEGKIYTPAQIRRANPRIVYWVYFPQGIERRIRVGEFHVRRYSMTMKARTMKQAVKLANRYNSPGFERWVECDLGKFHLKTFALKHRTIDSLWDEWRLLEPVRIGRKG
jgi:hypothetical protein